MDDEVESSEQMGQKLKSLAPEGLSSKGSSVPGSVWKPTFGRMKPSASSAGFDMKSLQDLQGLRIEPPSQADKDFFKRLGSRPKRERSPEAPGPVVPARAPAAVPGRTSKKGKLIKKARDLAPDGKGPRRISQRPWNSHLFPPKPRRDRAAGLFDKLERNGLLPKGNATPPTSASVSQPDLPLEQKPFFWSR